MLNFFNSLTGLLICFEIVLKFVGNGLDILLKFVGNLSNTSLNKSFGIIG